MLITKLGRSIADVEPADGPYKTHTEEKAKQSKNNFIELLF